MTLWTHDHEEGQTFGWDPAYNPGGLLRNTTRLSHEACGGYPHIVYAMRSLELLEAIPQTQAGRRFLGLPYYIGQGEKP